MTDQLTTTYLLVDDHALVRQGVELMIRAMDPSAVVLSAGSIAEAVACLGRADPPVEIVLLDLGLPDAKGLSGVRRIRELCPHVRLGVVSADNSMATVMEVIGMGVVCYVPKQASTQVLEEGLRSLSAGRLFVPPDLQAGPAALTGSAPRAGSTEEDDIDARLAAMTPRQIEVLRGVLQGQSNKVIGFNLAISEQTVKMHVSSILRMLRVTSRTQLALRCARSSLPLLV